MATARLLAAFVPGRPLQFIVAIQNAGASEEELLVPRTLQPPEYFFTAVISDEAGRELYTSPRAKAGLKLNPDRAESYLSLAPGDALAAVLAIDPDELRLDPGRYRAKLRYHPGPFLGPGGAGAPGELEAEVGFGVG